MDKKTEKYTIVHWIKDFLERRKVKQKRSSTERAKHRDYLHLLFKVERYSTLLLRETRKRYNLLRKTKSISDEEKSKINRYTVLRYEANLARHYIIEDRYHQIRQWLYDASHLSFFFLVGWFYDLYLHHFFRIGSGAGDVLWKTIPGSMLVIPFMLVYQLIFSFAAGRITFYQRVFLMLSVLAGGMYYLSLPALGFSRYVVFAIVGLEVIRSISIILDTLISYGFERHIAKRLPEAIIVHNILLILNKIDAVDEKEEQAYLFPSTKQFLLTRLEYAAEFLENHMHPLLRTENKEANEWNKSQMRQIANSLRAKKKLIVLSKADTCKKIRRALIDFLIHFQKDEWGELDKLTLPQMSWRDTLKTQIPMISRNLIFGLLPISILLLVEYFKVVSKPFDESIIGVAVLWAILNLLWLDPSTKDKVNAMKEASGIFSSK